jgi:hypothetical protein
MIIMHVSNGRKLLHPKDCGLRHIQMWENRVRENIASKFVQVCHIDGKINLADVFTKEMKDTSHFVEIRDLFMCHRLST